jgi:hypothetical protein
VSQQINLFNPIFLKQRKIFAALPMVEALGAIVVGALLLDWYAGQSVAALEQEAAAGQNLLARREQNLIKARTQFAPRAKDTSLTTELHTAEEELKSLHDVSSVLQGGALGNTSGYAEYFRALSRQNVSGLWLTGVTINGAGNDIGVSGRAMQATLIPNYIARLTGERIMHGKTFAALDIARPAAVAEAAPPATPGPAQPVSAAFVEFNLQSTVAQEARK